MLSYFRPFVIRIGNKPAKSCRVPVQYSDLHCVLLCDVGKNKFSLMAKSRKRVQEFDSPWKDTLQAFLPAFVLFFFPDIYADIDWARGYESLDKEFQKIARKAKVGKRLADKLFKVWLKDGTEHWLLIHVEIQGDAEIDFPQRMFQDNSAARQLYNIEVISLAVLCDESPSWRPTTFAYGRWGCKMELTFRIAKLLDYADKVEELEASDNPFAAVVLAHLKATETKRDPLTRKQWKLRIVKGLYKRNWTKDEIVQLFVAIDWMMDLPDDLGTEFDAEMDTFDEEEHMQYISSTERRGEQRGYRKRLIESIAMDFDAKFGPSSSSLMTKVHSIDDLDSLRAFAKFLKRAQSIDEVRAYLK